MLCVKERQRDKETDSRKRQREREIEEASVCLRDRERNTKRASRDEFSGRTKLFLMFTTADIKTNYRVDLFSFLNKDTAYDNV